MFLGKENFQHYLDRRNKMSLKVRDVIRELKQFPDDYKVAFESYEVEGDGYRLYNVRIVEKDEDCKKMVLIK